MKSRHADHVAAVGGHGAVRSQRGDDHAAEPDGECGDGFLRRAAGNGKMAGEVRRLVLVDDQHVEGRQFVRRERRIGGERKDRARTGRAGFGRRGIVLRERHLHLQQQCVAGAQGAVRNGRRVGMGVGAGRERDGVLAGLVDGDDGQARGADAAGNGGEIDAAGLQFPERRQREVVIADGADHAHCGPGAARGQRLVGALATGDERVVRAVDRFARPGNALHARHQVDVDRAENGNHGVSSCLRRCSEEIGRKKVIGLFRRGRNSKWR